ncbi:hypothetical protein [Vibrio rumoiensis]|uniref:Uncharacterized protein n=1 Tax=Vibrio rumoiensis TaxID=76258 RepID=A0ABW7J0M6_9VIBR
MFFSSDRTVTILREQLKLKLMWRSKEKLKALNQLREDLETLKLMDQLKNSDLDGLTTTCSTTSENDIKITLKDGKILLTEIHS